MKRFFHAACWTSLLALAALAAAPSAAAPPTRQEAQQAMRRAVEFFRTRCSAEGGYVYRLSADLAKREGEGRVGKTTAWLQPPGTPSVGMAYLEAFRLTEDPLLNQAAVETADALLRGQLVSGGWYHLIEFTEKDRARYAYRVELDGRQPGRRRNATTFDDDKSQSAARFLMQLDKELNFQVPRLHEASLYALDAFCKAQYPNGAWPQRYDEFPDPDEFPVRRASYPESWPREFPGRDYKGFYTLNDNTIADVIETMFDAWDVYGERRYQDAARRGGDFMLLAQMPDPQPGWAQQYDRDMHPAWARKFEPPAITGGESQGVMRTLMQLYRRTGDKKYLEPIPRAVKYYRSSLLDDGRLARFYELSTNRPLYFTMDYQLTYEDDDLPTHYGFKVGSRLDRIESDYQRLLKTPAEDLWRPPTSQRPRMSRSLQRDAEQVVESLDSRGAWVEEGRLRYYGEDDPTRQVIDSRTFCRNLVTLARYVAASE